MFKKLKEDLTDWIKEADPKTIILYVIIFVLSALFLGTLVRFIIENVANSINGDKWSFRPKMMIEGSTWLVGVVLVLLMAAIYALSGGFRSSRISSKMLKGKAEKSIVEIVTKELSISPAILTMPV